MKQIKRYGLAFFKIDIIMQGLLWNLCILKYLQTHLEETIYLSFFPHFPEHVNKYEYMFYMICRNGASLKRSC